MNCQQISRKEACKKAVLLFASALYFFSLSAQTTATVNTGGAGWKRIAHVSGQGGRGFGKVSFYTTGGSFTPRMATVSWFHDWVSSAGIRFNSDSKSSALWSAVRITDDGTNCYLEVNFTSQVSTLYLISDNYGWRPATLYSGVLPDGGGTVRATANVGRMNIENQFMVDYNGNVGVGTADPQAKLAVNGTVLATEVKVKNDISVPDYVFEPDYELPALGEIEMYVKEHKHLPEIPSAKDIERDGLNLAEMNLLLLKKVEELTLYIIDQQKQLGSLKEQNTRQQKEIDQLNLKDNYRH